ncbi:Variant-specific surface protein [Giardia duodenalis]|uniref:Variant-specific surface protein n=1 Tax=Giardia intestinalis TaxID=5741 RepID=V6TUY8_GIAIN|nr:Variant-specific surface protein [Giardia intestinalis]
MFFELALLGCVLQIAQAACAEAADETLKCKTNMCNLQIGGTEAANKYCSQCSKPGEYLIDGACVTEVGSSGCAPQDPPDGTCKSCGAGYFLHKGGCYKFGGTPGSTICKDTVGSSGTAGVCSSCSAENGFFANLAPAATKQSCIACNETANINGLKGVVGCTACKPPSAAGDSNTPKAAICTACETTTPKYLKKADDGTTTCISANECTADQNKFFKVEDPIKKCVSCGDAQDAVDGCNTCTYDSGAKKVTCTKCTSNYLKTVAGTTTCEADCGDGYFQHTATSGDLKTCQSCSAGTSNAPAVSGIQNCVSCTYTSSTLKCTACGEGKKPNKEGTGCFDCGISGCTYCSGAGKCEECASGYTLDSQANTCASSSANRSGLSSGAIAGISVAAVVVVGGLVGFLCWWFVCRGKA